MHYYTYQCAGLHNLMTYDEAGTWEGKTGHHSKYSFCISGSQYYVNKGIPKEKVLMGVPFYGHTFKLQDKNKHGIGAPIAGEGKTPHGEGITRGIQRCVIWLRIRAGLRRTLTRVTIPFPITMSPGSVMMIHTPLMSMYFISLIK